MAVDATSDDVTAAALAAAVAAATTAEKYAVKGGNGGDLHGADGLEPVVKAAVEAAAGSPSVQQAVEEAARAASVRTNANAARVADAVIVVAKSFGAKPEVPTNPLTGSARYDSLSTFSAAPFTPDDP